MLQTCVTSRGRAGLGPGSGGWSRGARPRRGCRTSGSGARTSPARRSPAPLPSSSHHHHHYDYHLQVPGEEPGRDVLAGEARHGGVVDHPPVLGLGPHLRDDLGQAEERSVVLCVAS